MQKRQQYEKDRKAENVSGKSKMTDMAGEIA